MVPPNQELSAALKALDAQIEAAEKKLKRMPGSRHENASIDIWDEGDEFDWRLEFADDELVVRCYTIQYGHQSVVETKPLHSVPVTKRVEVAKEIPAFLTAASEAANDIASEARDAAESIEQSLADMD